MMIIIFLGAVTEDRSNLTRGEQAGSGRGEEEKGCRGQGAVCDEGAGRVVTVSGIQIEG